MTPEKLASAASQAGFGELKLAELAESLNVSMQTLYNHVRGRDELLYISAVTLGEQFQLPEDTGQDWVEWSWELAQSLRTIYLRAPGLATTLVSRERRNTPLPLKSGRWEVAQEIAERSGFHPVIALWANMAVHEFVFSWTAGEDQRETEPGPAIRALVDERERDWQSPLTTAAAAVAQNLPAAARFEFTMRALLNGLAAYYGKGLEDLLPNQAQALPDDSNVLKAMLIAERAAHAAKEEQLKKIINQM